MAKQKDLLVKKCTHTHKHNTQFKPSKGKRYYSTYKGNNNTNYKYNNNSYLAGLFEGDGHI